MKKELNIKPERASPIQPRYYVRKLKKLSSDKPKRRTSIGSQKRQKRKQSRHDLKLLVESFDADDVRKSSILEALKLKKERWLLCFRHRSKFEKFCKEMKTMKHAFAELQRQEFKFLKQKLRQFVQTRKVFSKATMCVKTREILQNYALDWVDDAGFDPRNAEKWFKDHILFDKRQPKQEHLLLYEWVENEVNEAEFVAVKEVRERASFLIDASFGKYDKFEKLGGRIKKFLDLRAAGENGQAKKWMKK